MKVTNHGSGTNVHEVAEGIYRISTPVQIPGGTFSFNQYLIADDEPLLFHTGPRRLFPLVREAVETVIPSSSLRHIALSHVEADECGSLNEWLAAAPEAHPLCSSVAAMVSIEDMADRSPRPMHDGESLALGRHTVTWYDVPHLPHAWDCGYLIEETTRLLFCGDLFTQGGDALPAVTQSDILDLSEAFRQQLDYYSHTKNALSMLERLAAAAPTTLACMHGSAWTGDGGALLRALGARLTA